MNLQPGQNLSITRQSPATRSVEVALHWDPVATPLEVDSSAFALTTQGKVRSDNDFIFYNQSTLAGGGIRRSAGAQQFIVLFDRLPADIEKIAFALTIHQGKRRGQAFSQLTRIGTDLRDAQTKALIGSFTLNTAAMPETAVIVAEIYRRNQEWKFRALGQGFIGGLGPLAQHYGVDISDDPDMASSARDESSPSSSEAVARPVPPPSPVRLEKITLEKKGQHISLEKRGRGFDEIVVNLNWNRDQKAGSGFLGRMMSTAQGIDLDLGCLFQLQDGRAGAVQALGDSFGSLQQAPYIQLMGDDRTGESAAGEFLHINGRQWDQIKRVLIYAFIYEGVPNWSAANAVVTLKTPGQPTLEVHLDNHRNDRGMCAIAMLENQGGNLHVTKLVEYFQNHLYMDRAYGFGLRWVAGSKD